MNRTHGVSFVLSIVVVLSVLAVLSFGPITAPYLSAQSSSPVASPKGEATTVPVRRVLATGQPPMALGHTLDLVRYDIPAGLVLPIHVHPGVQIAWVASGELTYHVLKGEVQVGRAVTASAAAPGAPEILGMGDTTVLYPGDWVVEISGAVHYGENLGTEPVVLWATTLLETGEPAAIPVNAEGTPVS